MDRKNETITLISKDEDYRSRLRGKFMGLGYRLLDSPDEDSAISTLRDQDSGIILLDVSAQGSTDFKALRKLNYSLPRMRAPIIVIVDGGDDARIVELLEAGATDYFIKNENFSISLSRVKVHLTTKQLERDLDLQRLRATTSAKMLALGELAGGAAHEINNPLAIAFAHLSRLSGQFDKLPEEYKPILRESVHRLELSLQRISKIVKAINNFSMVSGNTPMVPTDPRTFIEEAVLLSDPRFKTGNVTLILPETYPPTKILCRPTEMTHAVYNLLSNASDAVSTLDERWVRISIDLTDTEVVVSVTDSGIAPTGPLAERIFEPFFTTKPVGKGAGLGLSQALGLIKANHGSLEFDPGSAHTSFLIKLPRLH